MAFDTLSDAAYSLVATAPSPATSGTSLVVTAGEGARFPQTGSFDVVIWAAGAQPTWAAGGATGGNFEICRATISGDTLTLTRAQAGTTARTIVVGDQIAQNGTKAMMLQYQGLGGLRPTAVKTANYTAVAGDLVPCDTTSGSFTVTLPNAPVDNTTVTVKYVTQVGANTVTVACAGSDVINKASGTTSMTLAYVGQSVVLQYKSSGAIWYVVARDDAPLSVELGVGVYGDGSDGAVTFDGSTTILGIVPSGNLYLLTRDIFLADGSVINNGVTIRTFGYRVFCAGTLTNNGTIHWNGNDASTTTGGAAAGNSSSSINTFSSGGTAIGTPGGNGGTAAGTAGTTQSQAANAGATGGTGGTGTSGAGAAGGGLAAFQSSALQPRIMPFAMYGQYRKGDATGYLVAGGTGGGGGGGDGTNAGGGGGGGGAICIVVARLLAGTGSIRARGGAGGSPTLGNTGGGGGGGGGWVVVVSQSAVNGAVPGQTIDANGGAAGTAHGTGTANAAAGSNGRTTIIAH